jgi:hypothetical protein
LENEARAARRFGQERRAHGGQGVI